MIKLESFHEILPDWKDMEFEFYNLSIESNGGIEIWFTMAATGKLYTVKANYQDISKFITIDQLYKELKEIFSDGCIYTCKNICDKLKEMLNRYIPAESEVIMYG